MSYRFLCGIASIFLLLLFFLIQLTKKTSKGFVFESGYLLSIREFKGIYFSAFVKEILFFINRLSYVFSMFLVFFGAVFFLFCPLFIYFNITPKSLNIHEDLFFFISIFLAFFSLIMFFLSYCFYEFYKNVLTNQKKTGKLKLFLFKTLKVLLVIGLMHELFCFCLSCVYVCFNLYSSETFFCAFEALVLFLCKFLYFFYGLINVLEFWFNLDGKSYLALSRNGIRNENIKN